jgi:transposase-like protein
MKEKNKKYWCPKCERHAVFSFLARREVLFRYRCSNCGSLWTAADLDVKTVTLIKAISQ